MIRTKAKSLLLSIMLVFACSCFFACKETKINVDSVVFQEKSISMLVGDSYSPQIKILPSYATDRSYRLISSDPTALGVDGSTIVALRASVDVKLKVVSNDNENVNDVISVVIYDEPVTLISPTSLSFDGEAFSFVDLNDSSVSSYVLSINGSEINIGNNTKYAFESVVAKLGESLYNAELVCKVKAVGDNKIFIDSEYSEEITFTKYGKVQGARVLDERLYFTPVNNATGYTVKVLKAGNSYQTYNVEEYSAVDGVDLSMLTDSVNGAEYQIQILPKINDGEFNSSPESLNYVVLGKVSNLNISGDMISWDFVKNAQGYDLDLYQNSSLIKQYTNFSHNYLQIPANFVAGEYVFKIRAKSGMANTLQGAYNEISFKILTAPIVTAENNLVSWSSVDDAQGYFITITNNRGATIVSKKFVTNNTYDVSTFEAGDYTICVVANGNGGNVLASANSVPAVWSVLNNAALSVSNKVVSWEDVGATSYDFVCVSNADASEIINTSLSSASYDLSAVELDAGNYTISVTPRGTGTSFDAKTTTETITKLADATIGRLSNKQFAINKATSGVRYKLEINKVDDYAFAPIALEQMVDGNKFVLDDSVLSAGQYTAKVYVYGNDANIFDADNISAEYEFEKLNTPVIKYDKKTGASGSAVIKIIVESVDGSEKYNLMQNNVSITDGQEYDISTINAGDYVYTAQAVGNNADKLDSDITAEGVAIKKLSTPTIAFDKTTLQYTINTMDADKPCIENYYFTINGTSVPGVTTTNNVADCSEHMKNATNYTAIAYAVAKSGNKQYLGFDLIIDSESVAYDDVSKLSGLCTFKIEVVADNIANLIVEPVDTSALTGTGYKLNLKIGEIELDAFNCTTKVDEETHEACVENFVMNLYKTETEYEVIEVLNDIMNGSGEYGVSAVISNTNAKIVDSDRYTIPTTFKVLGKVDNIEKNGQVIEFNVVENATDYIAIVNLSGVETYIKLNNQYNVKAGDATKNQLAIDTLIELLGESKYRVETVYSIKFVALSNDSSTLANKGTTSYSFKFLKSPDIDIVEQEGSSIKYLSIQNNNDNAVQYYLVITYKNGEETKTLKEGIYTKVNDSAELISIDALDGYTVANGQLDIKVYANADTEGEYFNSKYTATSAIKLDVCEISVVDGKLQWLAYDNAKQYNLTYSLSGENETRSLKLGDTNFSVVEKEIDGKMVDVCVYDFVDLPGGNTNMWLQVDASLDSGHHLNSNTSSAKAIYKLPTLPINVSAGQISIQMKLTDIAKVSTAEILVDGVLSNIDIAGDEGDQNGVTTTTDLVAGTATMTISPTQLLKYNNMNYETLTIKLYSSDDSTLNSSTASKAIRGLLTPMDLDIATTLTTSADGAVTEVVEKIIWTNPRVNGANVGQYEVVVKYNDVDYRYITTNTFLNMPTYGDANSDGTKDEGEIDFGAGEYKIIVRALAKLTDNIDVVNSKHSDEISITILATPTEVQTKTGNITWTENDVKSEYYLTRVYLLNRNGSKTLIKNASSNGNEIDLSSIEFMETGVYGITVQAMSNDSKVLSSAESDMLQVIRLPHVTEYWIDDGELYIKVHKLYAGAGIAFTNIPADESDPVVRGTVSIANKSISDYIEEDIFDYLEIALADNWLESPIIDTYGNDKYYASVKYENEDDSTITSLLAEGYTLQIKLYGNTTTYEDETIRYAVISGTISNAHNINLTTAGDGGDVYTNEIVKLVTPTTAVSEKTCGQVLLSVPEGMKYNLSYYQDAPEGALEGVHLYETSITVGEEEYSFFVADIVDDSKFTADLIENNGLKYFVHNGKVFNVIEKITMGDKNYIPFNLNAKEYHYYNANQSGEVNYATIDLSVGGSFTLNARFIGDDTKFVQSNVSEDAIVKRYNEIKVALGAGVVSWDNLATDEEQPLYIIVANNSSTKESYSLVLYNEKFHALEDVESCLDSNAEYIKVPITYEVIDETITYNGLAEAIYNARMASADTKIKALAGTGGVFAVSIKAHHVNGTATNIIPAQTAEPVDATILPMTQIKLNEGALTWKLPYITTGSNAKYYLYNYVLKVYDETNTLIAQTTLTQSSYALSYESSNYIASYVPGIVGGVELLPETPYIFEIHTAPSSSETYVNSMSSRTSQLKICSKINGVNISEETLTWTDETTVQILISYTLDGVVITSKPITLVNATSYKLPSSFTDTTNTTRTLVPGHTYYLQIRKKGNSTNYISGFYSVKSPTARLSTISADSIMTNGGVLTWEHSTLDGEFVPGTTYTLSYKYNGVSTTVNNIRTNSYTFEEECLQGGEISISIVAQNQNLLRSRSTTAKLYKLTQPANISGINDTIIVTWDKVQDGEGVDVETYKVLINGINEYDCSTNQWEITGVTGTNFTIQVKAVSVVDGAMTVNGEYGSEVTINMPSAVTNVAFDDTIKAFKWERTADAQADDAYWIHYTYQGKDLSEEVSETKQVGDKTYYIHAFKGVGEYTNIAVQIKRPDSLASFKTSYNSTYNFDLFESGDGEDSPYVITTEVHLRNVKYFLDAKYQLGNDITLSNNEAITTSSQVFSGVFDGNSKTILGQASDSAIIYETALFECVQNATFKNLTLSKFNVQGNAQTEVFKLGVLANDANNCTFEGIIVVDSSIALDNSASADSILLTEVYVGGLVGYAEDSDIAKCEVMLYNTTKADGSTKYGMELSVIGNGETAVYVGGIAGAIVSTQTDSASIDDCYSDFEIYPYMEPISTIAPSLYIGTMAGHNQGANITNVDVDSQYYKYPFIATEGQPEHLPITNIVGKED